MLLFALILYGAAVIAAWLVRVALAIVVLVLWCGVLVLAVILEIVGDGLGELKVRRNAAAVRRRTLELPQPIERDAHDRSAGPAWRREN